MRDSSYRPEMFIAVTVMASVGIMLWLWLTLDPALSSVSIQIARRLVESGMRLGS